MAILDDKLSRKVINDQPLPSAELFNFDTYAKALAEIISVDETETPFVIGIFGDWGSGKTSLMQTIEGRIKKLFFSEHLKDPVSLANKLRSSPISSMFIKENEDLPKLLDNYDGSNPPSEELQSALVKRLNELLDDTSLIKKECFAHLEWIEDAKKLITNERGDIRSINKFLLEEIYPSELLFFCDEDFNDKISLAKKLIADFESIAKNSDSLPDFFNKFSPDITKLANQFEEKQLSTKDKNTFEKSLIDIFNRLLIEPSLFPYYSEKISVKKNIIKLVQRMEKPDCIILLRRNSILLEEAHPDEIKKKSGSSFFSIEDFEDLNRLANMIVDDIKQEFPDSKHMYGDFSSEIIKLLDALQNNSIIYEEKNVLKKAVTDKINQLLTYPSFHHLYYIKSFKQLNLLKLKKKSQYQTVFPFFV